jgi:hypothetical protein
MRIRQNHHPQLILLPLLRVGTAVQGEVVHQKLAEHQRRNQAHRRNPTHGTRSSHPDHGLESLEKLQIFFCELFTFTMSRYLIFDGLDVPRGVASQLLGDFNAVDLQLKRDLLEKSGLRVQICPILKLIPGGVRHV